MRVPHMQGPALHRRFTLRERLTGIERQAEAPCRRWRDHGRRVSHAPQHRTMMMSAHDQTDLRVAAHDRFEPLRVLQADRVEQQIVRLKRRMVQRNERGLRRRRGDRAGGGRDTWPALRSGQGEDWQERVSQVRRLWRQHHHWGHFGFFPHGRDLGLEHSVRHRGSAPWCGGRFTRSSKWQGRSGQYPIQEHGVEGRLFAAWNDGDHQARCLRPGRS